ncbi:MAG: 3-dehydroquinate synthase [Armatimonadetes bacterium CG2_30_59_28]|nr:3-dehydroquinate synthase [Armatimonadota bacterium]OIO96844.1 MAG: 3-dehydroquinate synthase [Armatimonadetes bacterium CG2_30_59_28]PIU60553.1 MAG: 3-dehydroquinate synthase [Armatimonadetes bacterium CG07_land_8_20_14_0_80_59_28]PIY48127.1 MAG: 3-dehydroquinate synthase [Armatimonadetes bacterium CG_4_10_14_3_um_filter_59_10]PJB61889.1 MAG: 3-dehydroquinate synthase [Armatimonadetes bacterium CG_4_9_14_3_um_filter_58_7]
MASEVPVNIGERSYRIHIEWGSLERAPELLKSRGLQTRLFLITHPTLNDLYGRRLQEALSLESFPIITAEIPEGEGTKSLRVAAELYDRMVDARLSRDSAIIALGGGVVGDISGFVAATYMRGIRFIQIPTTLLSQVDASVGGKVAVNHPQAKNLIGAFHQPSFVLMDPGTLISLPKREVRAGLAEVVKYGVIYDEQFFRFIEENADSLLRLDSVPVEEMLRRSCEIKAWVVEQDERESGLRAILNFGHTIGHAVEAVFGYGELLHGECVAVGMVAASRIAVAQELCDSEVEARLTGLLQRIGLPISIPACPIDPVLQAMRLDKKGDTGGLRFVLPERMGRVTIARGIPEQTILQAVESIMV